MLKHKTDTESTAATSTAGSSRVQRAGELGSTLFPPYCMLCKSEKSIKVKGKKQYPKVLREINAEMSIRETARLHNDEKLLTAIMPETLSLHSAEFKIHDKCCKDYTQICPPKRKRERVEESLLETFDASDDDDDVGGHGCEGGEEQQADEGCNIENVAEVEQVATNTIVLDDSEGSIAQMIDEYEENSMNIEEQSTVDDEDDDSDCSTEKDSDSDLDFVLTQHPKEHIDQGDAASYSKGDANKLFEYV